MSSELDGNPPIWITKKSPEEIYVNQAKIVFHLANYEHNNTNGKPQVRIHFICLKFQKKYIYIFVLFFKEEYLQSMQQDTISKCVLFKKNVYNFYL